MAVLVVLSMAAGAPAADVVDIAAAHDREEHVNASSLEEGTPDVVSGETVPAPDAETEGAPFVPDLEPLTRVRIVTLPPSDVRGAVVEEDSRSVLLEDAPSGRRFALSKAGHRLEGQIGSIDGDSVTLLSKNPGIVRVRRQDIVRLQVPGEGSFPLGLTGGFLGYILGRLARARPGAEVTRGTRIVDWIVLIGSTVIGAKLLGRGRWKTIPLPGGDRVSLVLTPTPHGAAVGLSVAF